MLVPVHPFGKIEITKYSNYRPRFHNIFSRDNLPRINDNAYAINLDDKQSNGTHWVPLFIDKNTAVQFNSIWTGYNPQDALNEITDKSITHNIFRIQSDDSVMCEFNSIDFIECKIVGKTLFDYTNLFSPNIYQKNDKIIDKYFKENYGKKNVSLDVRLKNRQNMKLFFRRNET